MKRKSIVTVHSSTEDGSKAHIRDFAVSSIDDVNRYFLKNLPKE
jgi:hypothetical protein